MALSKRRCEGVYQAKKDLEKKKSRVSAEISKASNTFCIFSIVVAHEIKIFLLSVCINVCWSSSLIYYRKVLNRHRQQCRITRNAVGILFHGDGFAAGI